MILKNQARLLRCLLSVKHTPSQFNVSTSAFRLNQNVSNSEKPPFLVEYKQDYAILKLDKAPVNSLNLELLTALAIQLEKFEQSKDLNGIILASNIPNIFSAGLDIMEMYQCKPERARQFWQTLQEVWIKLYGSNKVWIAAINGASPAGGCLLAMTCDYRIMAKGKYKIGLNETLLGIKAPFWFCDTMINTIGYRETEKALQLGKLYSDVEALKINLVDEIVELSEVLPKAEEQMKIWLKIPVVARELTKSSMRRDIISKLLSQREADTNEFVDFTTKEYVQKSLGAYLESLKIRKSK